MPYYDESQIDRLKDTISDLKAKLKEQDAILRNITKLSRELGLVIKSGSMPLVLVGEKLEEVPTTQPVKPGDTVLITVPNMEMPVRCIVEVASYTLNGDVAILKRIASDMLLEVLLDGKTLFVYSGSITSGQEGDRILLDASNTLALQNLGQEDEEFTYAVVNVSWDQIGGQEDAKKVLREAIELPVLYGELFSGYNKQPLKGAILSGPPGNGKTLLGKAAATAANALYGGHGPSPFMYIKGGELLKMYVGASEAAIRGVFNRARKYIARYNSPLVVFFDEAEALFGKRGAGISSDIRDTMVPAMLSEMDGFDSGGPFVLMATNRLDMIDPAIMRDERISRVLHVAQPTKEVANSIYKIHLTNKPIKKKLDLETLSAYGVEELFNQKLALPNGHPLSSVVSGAMIAGIVDRTVSVAIHRDIASGVKKATGLCLEDMRDAIFQTYAEQSRLNTR